MYGPRSSYDAATLAENDRRMKDLEFRRRLLKALRDPEVREAIRKLIEEESKA